MILPSGQLINAKKILESRKHVRDYLSQRNGSLFQYVSLLLQFVQNNRSIYSFHEVYECYPSEFSGKDAGKK